MTAPTKNGIPEAVLLARIRALAPLTLAQLATDVGSTPGRIGQRVANLSRAGLCHADKERLLRAGPKPGRVVVLMLPIVGRRVVQLELEQRLDCGNIDACRSSYAGQHTEPARCPEDCAAFVQATPGGRTAVDHARSGRAAGGSW